MVETVDYYWLVRWHAPQPHRQQAAAAAHSGELINWSALAQAMGFSDQSHLTRVFTQVVGTSPEAYHRDPDTR